MSTLEYAVPGLDLPVGGMNRTATLATGKQITPRSSATVTGAGARRLGVGMGLSSRPYANTGLAVSTPVVPAEAVRRPYDGSIPAPTQKGLPQ
ncbi:hypothetical protein [Streptomyces sp. NPDC005374]|uniref:hypothetical protein n=1 Tax=Streptomyces sp. NPDC005374 TaxID=3364713 RepID=UPI003684422F